MNSQNTGLLYDIVKSYDSAPSKNRIWESGLTMLQAKQELSHIANRWKQTGIVSSESEDDVVVEEADSSETIRYYITESKVNND